MCVLSPESRSIASLCDGITKVSEHSTARTHVPFPRYSNALESKPCHSLHRQKMTVLSSLVAEFVGPDFVCCVEWWGVGSKLLPFLGKEMSVLTHVRQHHRREMPAAYSDSSGEKPQVGHPEWQGGAEWSRDTSYNGPIARPCQGLYVEWRSGGSKVLPWQEKEMSVLASASFCLLRAVSCVTGAMSAVRLGLFGF